MHTLAERSIPDMLVLRDRDDSIFSQCAKQHTKTALTFVVYIHVYWDAPPSTWAVGGVL
jgi:hypothetical protein